MTGYPNFLKHFSPGTFVSSSVIAKKFSLPKALASLYIIPSFFRGVYYIPAARERAGRFIEKPAEFFSRLFDFVYGRKNWYWSLGTAARRYGIEWSATRILEVVTPYGFKTIRISERTESLENKRSYRSKKLAQIIASLGVNLLIIHKGKKGFLKETKIDPDIGPIATIERLKKDARFFLPRTKEKALRQLYKKYLY